MGSDYQGQIFLEQPTVGLEEKLVVPARWQSTSGLVSRTRLLVGLYLTIEEDHWTRRETYEYFPVPLCLGGVQGMSPGIPTKREDGKMTHKILAKVKVRFWTTGIYWWQFGTTFFQEPIWQS